LPVDGLVQIAVIQQRKANGIIRFNAALLPLGLNVGSRLVAVIQQRKANDPKQSFKVSILSARSSAITAVGNPLAQCPVSKNQALKYLKLALSTPQVLAAVTDG